MKNMQYKLFDLSENITTVFTNDAYDIVHCGKGLNIDYKTADKDIISLCFLKDLIKLNNDLNSIILIINDLVKQNVLSSEIAEYILHSININYISKQHKKNI